MCWSAEASTVLAVAGFGITTYAVIKREPWALWGTLGFFAGMEALQAFSYTVIDQCGTKGNDYATKLAYLHIMLQPFFFNALALYFIPNAVRLRVQKYVYGVCAGSFVFMFWQMMPSEAYGICAPHRAMCGEGFCTYSGNWHLAWTMPFNGYGNWFIDARNPILWMFPNGLITYGFAVFIMPLLYGAWRITAFQYFMGPVLVGLMVTMPDERPAVWCLMSLGIAVIIIYSPLRQFFRVHDWPMWPKELRRGINVKTVS